MGRRRRTSARGGTTLKELSPQLQNQIAQYQQMQQQLQVYATQRVQLEANLREVEQTLEELARLTDETPVYRSIGILLVKTTDREGLRKELEETKETLTIRIKTLQKQEKAVGEKFEELGAKIQSALGPAPTAG